MCITRSNFDVRERRDEPRRDLSSADRMVVAVRRAALELGRKSVCARRSSYACIISRNGRAAAPPPGVNVKRILVSFWCCPTTGIGPHEISFSMRIAFNASCASMRSSLVAVGGSSGSRNS